MIMDQDLEYEVELESRLHWHGIALHWCKIDRKQNT